MLRAQRKNNTDLNLLKNSDTSLYADANSSQRLSKELGYRKVTPTTTNSINTDPPVSVNEDGESMMQASRPSFLDNDVDHARSEAELQRRRQMIIQKLESYEEQ